MSVDKKSTTLYLRRDILRQCKDLNINISDTVNRILSIVLESPGIHDEEIALAILKVTKSNIETEMNKRQAEIKQMQLHIDQLNAKIERQQTIVDEIQRSDAIAQLMRQLNSQIRDLEYDEVKIRQSDVLTELRKLKVPVDQPEWLKRQIERVKRLTL